MVIIMGSELKFLKHETKKRRCRRRGCGNPQNRLQRYADMHQGYGNNTEGIVELPVTGPALWLRADDPVLSTFTDGDKIGTWFDQSGNSNDAIRVTDDTHRPTWKENITNSKPGVLFAATGDANHEGFVTGNFAAAFTAGEVFLVGKAAADVPAAGVISGLWDYGTSIDAEHFPFTDGNYYAEWGRTNRINTGPIAANIANVYLLNISSDASDWIIRINNAVHYSGAGSPSWATSGFLLGRSFSGFGYVEHNGYMFEIVMFDRVLTPAERAAMVTYFNRADRWGTAF